jgi:hypothetical protein
MSRTPSLAELDHVSATMPNQLHCQYCLSGFGKTGAQTLADVVQATTDHRIVCPNWPVSRPRTAQHRPLAGQTAIPLPE